MRTIYKDFDFLRNLLTEFFAQRSLRSRFRIMEETNISGWEIWLQVELALFLQKHDDVSQWQREKRHSLDMRKSDYWNNASIDFSVRQKHAHSFIPLEIKQHKIASQCIKYMAEDIKKFRNIKDSEHITGRSLWCMGIHNQVDEKTIEKYLERYNCAYNDKCIWLYKIPSTNYMITLI
jgi:hypothetical protein